MIIKSFTADSVAAALKEVRAELGGEAVVLKTRQLVDTGDGNRIEITACLDKPTAAQASAALQNRELPSRADKAGGPASKATSRAVRGKPVPGYVGSMELEKLSQIERKLDLLLRMNTIVGNAVGTQGEHVRDLYLRMRNAAVDEESIETLLARVSKTSGDDQTLTAAVEEELRRELSTLVAPKLQFRAGDKLLFVGPPGSGKTSVLGKLAGQLVAQGKEKITLVSLDSDKVGAADEIHSYAELLGVPVTDSACSQTSEKSDDKTITLIDSSALSRCAESIRMLQTRAERFNPNYRLVTLSCLARSADMVGFVQRVQTLAPTHLILTMLDLTERWGTIIVACKATGLPLALVTDSPSGVGSVQTPDSLLIARKILNAGADSE